MAAPAFPNSTTVRASVPPRLRGIRVVFGALERCAPDLAARWAVRLWCRPPDAGARRRDDRPGPGRVSRLAAAGSPSVAVETWGHGAPVYLLHGWGGWRGQLGAFVEPLVDAGFRAVAIDAPSHGDSTHGALGRRQSTLLEFAQTLTAAVGAHGHPAAVITHSMGGAAAALAVRDGLSVPRVVMVAPAADPVAQTRQFAQVLGIGPRTHRRMLARLEALGSRPLTDFDARTLSRDQAPATLVIHDRNDREVSYSEGVAIASTWPQAELISTDGLGHRRILRDAGVVTAAVEYVRVTTAA